MSTNKSILKALTGSTDSIPNDRSILLCEVLSYIPNLNNIMFLSAEYYEKKETKARIAFVKRMPSGLSPKYKEKVLFHPANIRQITKFLASADKEHPLIMKLNDKEVLSDDTPAYYAVGISSKDDFLLKDAEFSVQFNGHMSYSFYIGDNHYFDFEKGKYCVPKDNFDELCEIMKGMYIPDNCINNFVSHIEALIKGGHGTTLVLCTCHELYENELKRLINVKRGIQIEPIDLFAKSQKADSFLNKTAVADGGFLVDSDGKCGAVNVIFDGEIKPDWKEFTGESSRGSRYNSLKTYVYGKNGKCIYCDSCSKKSDTCNENKLRVFAIVISDDGMVNIISCIKGTE